VEHQLDMLDGQIDGTPPLDDAKLARRWQKVMSDEYERLCRDAEHGRPTLLDDYGATNEGEFFAVATECFFDRPAALRERHPSLYGVLRDYFQQDPAARPSFG
jgi:Mlc titration factor MtfA (ptsG expression regulator)